jgi:hypothetical protein
MKNSHIINLLIEKFVRNEYKMLKSQEKSKYAGITDERLRIMCIAGLKKLRLCIDQS